MRRHVSITAAALVLVVGARAAADPEPMPSDHATLTSGDGELKIPSGRILLIPRGSHVLAPPAWDKLDAELRRLQTAETRLTAENKTFRAEAPGWRPGWKMILGATLTGFASGLYAYHRFQ